ncbi:MAG TPA: hypothetical protein VGO30_09955 [Mycobacterium sp.]|jgi:hypothetical protein|nr:hypothetical protein [Mycobacterium sp.]
MFKIVCRYGGVGITTVGAGALLIAGYGSLAAGPGPYTVPEIQPTAAFSFNQLLPWVVAPSPSTSSTGAATVSAVVTDAAAAANGALQTVNQLGPLTFDLDSLRSFSANQPPPGSTAGTANYTQMDQWLAGVAGLASSTGALGFTDNGVSYDPYVGTHAGVLQTANQLGPFMFDLNVLKAIGFTQAPTGQVGVNGQPDNFSSVDIGRWTAGIPGVITNSGTTGFVTYQDFANGPFYDYRVGGLHTTTQVGSMTFDFNFLPYISTGVLLPPTLSFGLSPDMTAANTPFAPFSPPPPGVVQPMGGLSVPAAVAAPAPTPLAVSAATVSDPVAENPVDETATPETSGATAEKPTTVIPGVNGAPLAKPPATATSGAGGGNPFKPFQPITDMITNGIGVLTGTRPAAPSGTESSGGPDSGGGSSSGSESGGGTGSGAG